MRRAETAAAAVSSRAVELLYYVHTTAIHLGPHVFSLITLHYTQIDTDRGGGVGWKEAKCIVRMCLVSDSYRVFVLVIGRG